MRAVPTEHYRRSLMKMPPQVRGAAYKQVTLLIQNLRHPSLRAKKYDESENVWQARVTRNVRMYFQAYGDTYLLLDIEKHKD